MMTYIRSLTITILLTPATVLAQFPGSPPNTLPPPVSGYPVAPPFPSPTPSRPLSPGTPVPGFAPFNGPNPGTDVWVDTGEFVINPSRGETWFKASPELYVGPNGQSVFILDGD